MVLEGSKLRKIYLGTSSFDSSTVSIWIMNWILYVRRFFRQTVCTKGRGSVKFFRNFYILWSQGYFANGKIDNHVEIFSKIVERVDTTILSHIHRCFWNEKCYKKTFNMRRLKVINSSDDIRNDASWRMHRETFHVKGQFVSRRKSISRENVF